MILRERGFGIVQALVLAAVLAAFGLFVAQMAQRASLSSKQMNTVAQAKQPNELLIRLPKVDNFVDVAVVAGTSTSIRDCIKNPDHTNCPNRTWLPTDAQLTDAQIEALTTSPPANENRPITVTLPTGETYDGRANSTSGFKTDGTYCNTYPSNECPLHMNYSFGWAFDIKDEVDANGKWEFENPIVVYGDLLVHRGFVTSQINPERFKVRYRARTSVDHLRALCEGLNGEFVYGNSITEDRCRCKNTGGIISASCRTFKEVSGCGERCELIYNSTTRAFSCGTCYP